MKGAQFEIYKLAYWPCVRAKRLNSTEFNPLWATESDKIGGQREWAHENVYAGVKKVRTFEFSKIWVYGSADITHGDMFFSINGVEYLLNENTTTRVDGVLVFESEILPLDHYTVTFSQHFEDCVLYCVYYLPISVPIEQISITGLYGTSLVQSRFSQQ